MIKMDILFIMFSMKNIIPRCPRVFEPHNVPPSLFICSSITLFGDQSHASCPCQAGRD